MGVAFRAALCVIFGGIGSLHGMRADYASPIWERTPRADGKRHVDAPATIAKLLEMHADTYFYLIHGETDWDDMRKEFLPAAAEASLNVWLYLVPPSECPPPCALPFQSDYVRMATEIAKLSLEYPNLKGMAIDDFAYNTQLFTPEYVVRLRQAGKAVNPSFRFYPLLYWRSLTPEMLDRYAPGIDGVIFAYRDEPTINTTRNQSLREQLDRAESLLAERNKALVLMVYCAPLGRIPIPPGVDYVRSSVATGLSDVKSGKLEGVVTYKLDKQGLPAPMKENYARSGNGRGTMLVSGLNLKAGSFGELHTRIHVRPGEFRNGSLTFWRTAFYSRLPEGYLFLQILLNGQPLWEKDIASFKSGVWEPERVEFGGMRSSGTAALQIRTVLRRDASSLTVTVGVDDLDAPNWRIGDRGFEDPAEWATKHNDPAFLPLVQIFDPQRPIQMFHAVRDIYGAARQ